MYLLTRTVNHETMEAQQGDNMIYYNVCLPHEKLGDIVIATFKHEWQCIEFIENLPEKAKAVAFYSVT